MNFLSLLMITEKICMVALTHWWNLTIKFPRKGAISAELFLPELQKFLQTQLYTFVLQKQNILQPQVPLHYRFCNAKVVYIYRWGWRNICSLGKIVHLKLLPFITL